MKANIVIPNKYVKAFCVNFGYQLEVVDEKGNPIPNPEPMEDFARRMLEGIVENAIIAYEANVAQDEARAKTIAEVAAKIKLEKGKE